MKYELTNEAITHSTPLESPVLLFRIRALKDFKDVARGDFGGFIENESNLSQEGNCWIYNDAKVYDGALVKDNASIKDLAQVCGSGTIVSTKSDIAGTAIITMGSEVTSNSNVLGCAKILSSKILDSSYVWGSAIIENSIIKKESKVRGSAAILDSTVIKSCLSGDMALINGIVTPNKKAIHLEDSYNLESKITFYASKQGEAFSMKISFGWRCYSKKDFLSYMYQRNCGNIDFLRTLTEMAEKEILGY